MKKITSILIVLLLCSINLLCTREFAALNPENQVRDLSQSEQQIVETSSEFGFELFSKLHSAYESENLFISPLSVSMALGMTFNGAANQTVFFQFII